MNPESVYPLQNDAFRAVETDIELVDSVATAEYAAEESDQIITQADSVESDPSFKGWLKRHKLGAGVGIVAVGAAATVAPHMAETAHAIGDNATWAIPTLIATEAAWNSGAAMMLVSAGKKIGNPLTLHSRIGELLSSVGKSKLFKAGLGVNIVGELGTASVLTAGSIAELPPQSWPLTIGGAAVLMAPGVGLWAGIHRANKAEKEGSK